MERKVYLLSYGLGDRIFRFQEVTCFSIAVWKGQTTYLDGKVAVNCEYLGSEEEGMDWACTHFRMLSSLNSNDVMCLFLP